MVARVFLNCSMWFLWFSMWLLGMFGLFWVISMFLFTGQSQVPTHKSLWFSDPSKSFFKVSLWDSFACFIILK